uniref:B30.2/SPRY domain-containing protein n=1 Tax=Eptatretus burgeri TaxID=7764 RepID=A0A8C4PXI5_EPTBU
MFSLADAVYPTVDLNSANQQIVISSDLHNASLNGIDQQYPKHPDRFNSWKQVLSFSSGRHYWEVDVRSSCWCRIGICLNSMRRKGELEECALGRNPESWCIEKCTNKYLAMHNRQWTDLSVLGHPERFGFFLDCEEGELTCFGDSRVLHVFRGNFMEPVKPAIVVCDVGFSIRFCSF